jgi:hypothetical protein
VTRPAKEGRILERGVVKAAEIAAGLGLGGAEPEVRPTEKLTPQQARRKSEGKPIGPGAPDFEQVTIAGGRDAYEHLGMPDLSTAEAHKISGRPGPEPPERAPKAEPQRTDWDAIDAMTKLDDAPRSPADTARPQDSPRSLINDWKARAAKDAHAAIQAKGTDREATAVAELKKTTALGQQIKRKLGGE